MSDAADQTGTQSSTSLAETSAAHNAVRAVERAVSHLELARSYIERDLDQTRAEMRDVRDRLKAAEVKIDALPSKIWIGSVVLGGMTILSVVFGAIVALIKLLSH